MPDVCVFSLYLFVMCGGYNALTRVLVLLPGSVILARTVLSMLMGLYEQPVYAASQCDSHQRHILL